MSSSQYAAGEMRSTRSVSVLTMLLNQLKDRAGQQFGQDARLAVDGAVPAEPRRPFKAIAATASTSDTTTGNRADGTNGNCAPKRRLARPNAPTNAQASVAGNASRTRTPSGITRK